MLFSKPHALLMPGSEERFDHGLHALGKVLRLSCEKVSWHRLAKATETLKVLETTLRKAPLNAPVLIAFNGHGSKMGWEAKGRQKVAYRRIVDVVCRFPHRILFLNDTCYGQWLIRELIGRRRSYITGCITSWESDEIAYSGAIGDAAKYWSKRMVVENDITSHTYSADHGEYDMPVQQRWGAAMDHFFFPPSTDEAQAPA